MIKLIYVNSARCKNATCILKHRGYSKDKDIV